MWALSVQFKYQAGGLMYNEQANKAYIETQFQIGREIKALEHMLADHNQTAVNITWTHVGDMQHILSQLKQLNGEENE